MEGKARISMQDFFKGNHMFDPIIFFCFALCWQASTFYDLFVFLNCWFVKYAQYVIRLSVDVQRFSPLTPLKSDY